MKNILSLSLFLVLFLAFSSCEEIKDATTLGFNTTLEVDIPVAVTSVTGIAKSAMTSYSFSQTVTGSLADNEEINNYLNMLNSIEITDVEVIFSGLGSSQVIESIAISIEGVGVITTLTNVSSSNLVHNPTIDNSLLTQLASKLKSNKQVTVTVSGTTNSAPMNFNVKTNYDLHIEASPL